MADAAALKKATLQRAAAASDAEARAHAKASVAGRLKGVAALLAELELDKYAEAFAAAGYDDARLRAVAEHHGVHNAMPPIKVSIAPEPEPEP